MMTKKLLALLLCALCGFATASADTANEIYSSAYVIPLGDSAASTTVATWTDGSPDTAATLVGGNNTEDLTADGPGFGFSRSMHFDGGDDKVTIAQTDIAGEFTVAFWAKADTLPSTHMMILGDGTDADFIAFFQTGNFRVRLGGFHTVAHGVDIRTWHHYMVTRDSSGDVTLFVDGSETATLTTGNSETLNLAQIGTYVSNALKFDGQLAGVLIDDADHSASASELAAGLEQTPAGDASLEVQGTVNVGTWQTGRNWMQTFLPSANGATSYEWRVIANSGVQDSGTGDRATASLLGGYTNYLQVRTTNAGGYDTGDNATRSSGFGSADDGWHEVASLTAPGLAPSAIAFWNADNFTSGTAIEDEVGENDLDFGATAPTFSTNPLTGRQYAAFTLNTTDPLTAAGFFDALDTTDNFGYVFVVGVQTANPSTNTGNIFGVDTYERTIRLTGATSGSDTQNDHTWVQHETGITGTATTTVANIPSFPVDVQMVVVKNIGTTRTVEVYTNFPSWGSNTLSNRTNVVSTGSIARDNTPTGALLVNECEAAIHFYGAVYLDDPAEADVDLAAQYAARLWLVGANRDTVVMYQGDSIMEGVINDSDRHPSWNMRVHTDHLPLRVLGQNFGQSNRTAISGSGNGVQNTPNLTIERSYCQLYAGAVGNRLWNPIMIGHNDIQTLEADPDDVVTAIHTWATDRASYGGRPVWLGCCPDTQGDTTGTGRTKIAEDVRDATNAGTNDFVAVIDGLENDAIWGWGNEVNSIASHLMDDTVHPNKNGNANLASKFGPLLAGLLDVQTIPSTVILRFEDNLVDENGIVTPTPTGTATYTTGQFGQALLIDPSGAAGVSKLEIDHDEFMQIGRSFSFGMWTRLDSTGTSDLDFSGIFGKPGTDITGITHEWGLTYNNATGVRLKKNSSTNITDTFSVGSFHYVVMTYDHETTTATLYVDGAAAGTSVVEYNNSNEYLLGSAQAGAGYRIMDGAIDDFRFEMDKVWVLPVVVGYQNGYVRQVDPTGNVPGGTGRVIDPLGQ